MTEEGAALVDVGGESTRPGAEPVTVDEEMGRVIPVIEGLANSGMAVSVDTSKPEVARAAVDSGAVVINDVTGFTRPAMIEVAVESGAGVVVMHMRGEPRSMQQAPAYGDVVAEVRGFLLDRASRLIEAGVRPSSIVVDPGVGFGKTPRHNLDLIDRLGDLVSGGFPVMVGTSRKSTIEVLTGEADPKRRDGHTAVTTALAFERGARLFRVHNVPESRDALRIAAAIVDPKTWDEWQQDSSPGVSPG